MDNDSVKKCTLCGQELTALDLAYNPDLKLIGMIYLPGEDGKAYYFFQHDIKDCGTSIAVNIEVMNHLITEAIPVTKLTSTDCCEKHCLNLQDLSVCKQECYYAPYRRFLFKMINQKKQDISNLQPIGISELPKN